MRAPQWWIGGSLVRGAAVVMVKAGTRIKDLSPDLQFCQSQPPHPPQIQQPYMKPFSYLPTNALLAPGSSELLTFFCIFLCCPMKPFLSFTCPWDETI